MAGRPRKSPTHDLAASTDNKEEEQKQEPLFHCHVIVHCDNAPSRTIDLGQVNEEQLNTVNMAIRVPFEQLSTTRDLFLVDTQGIGWHFNKDKVVCVEVRVS